MKHPTIPSGTLRERLLQDQPARARRLDVAGIDTYVVEAGQGPPLLLLHGGIESGGAYWAPVLADLAADHRLIVPDAPGLGESAPARRLDPDTFAAWLTELIALTCAEPPTLVAHSLLGTYAVGFVARREAPALRHLLIWSAPGIGPYRMPLGLRLAAVAMALHPSERGLERFARWPFRDLDRERRNHGPWFDLFLRYTLDRARQPHVKRAMRQLIGVATSQIPDKLLRAIAVPTGLIWGTHDRMVPLGLAQAAAVRLEWPLFLVENTGHVPTVEDPGAFTATLRAAIAALNARA